MADRAVGDTGRVANDGVVARVLGPVQLVTADGVVDLPSASQRRLVASLAIHAPHPVRSEWLCSVLDATAGALRQSVARLRKVVGDGVVHTSATGSTRHSRRELMGKIFFDQYQTRFGREVAPNGWFLPA